MKLRVLLLPLALACTPSAGHDAGTPISDAGRRDAGTPSDAGSDAGVRSPKDAGSEDAGAPDAGPFDGGYDDGGAPYTFVVNCRDGGASYDIQALYRNRTGHCVAAVLYGANTEGHLATLQAAASPQRFFDLSTSVDGGAWNSLSFDVGSCTGDGRAPTPPIPAAYSTETFVVSSLACP